MKASEMWELYSRENTVSPDYDVWAFGDDPDRLSELVLTGVKTATSSAFDLYALEGEDLPKAGEYSIILNSQAEAVCIIRTERVYVCPFSVVSPEHA